MNIVASETRRSGRVSGHHDTVVRILHRVFASSHHGAILLTPQPDSASRVNNNPSERCTLRTNYRNIMHSKRGALVRPNALY